MRDLRANDTRFTGIVVIPGFRPVQPTCARDQTVENELICSKFDSLDECIPRSAMLSARNDDSR